jgi:hypothetical protein
MTLIYIWLGLLSLFNIFLLLVIIGILKTHTEYNSLFTSLSNFCTQQSDINMDIGTTLKAMSKNLTAINNVFTRVSATGDRP